MFSLNSLIFEESYKNVFVELGKGTGSWENLTMDCLA